MVELDLNLGDGLITHGTATNLEWLDLMTTQGLTYNQAEATTYVMDCGFRRATTDEVETVFTNAGFGSVTVGSSPADDPAAA